MLHKKNLKKEYYNQQEQRLSNTEKYISTMKKLERTQRAKGVQSRK
jgi:hypothetical protein